ncbi:TPA: zincin-like metallopeptidase domain-containing protein [Klebsiella oxytoca]|uniref:ArdC family protein n=2 Tax=Klebsiella TaxID=570 RepID=UPI00040F4CB9|nr:zincin-like metallopeptidase domain-containing protein [Klebsiella oxytoca]EIX9035746.1 DUF1738 domain-containing protein [Klebsiella oxytoca]EIZ1085102.1 DUF1738 domain-containing protein [Klebsiella oxytoca]ELW9512204.1 DUF1738 domain-containing protein [Klebsiella oxytoca]MDM4410330.1 zincin-like metallopeptidase domain-containing protein [Klebsiella oxytoca]HBM2950942.1 DUF1738 domain-containing protein [Klebsiella oxytoca]
MNRSNDLYQKVTDEIIAALEKGVIPWVRPWREGEPVAPMNALSGRFYHGINIPLLWNSAERQGYESDRWLTFTQIRNAGGNIRKGEKSTLAVFYLPQQREVVDSNGNTVLDADGNPKLTSYAVVREFRLFNIQQCEELPEAFSQPVVMVDDPIAAAEQVARQSAVVITHRRQNRAYYSPGRDCIIMPHPEQFTSREDYYGTLLHELTHATGHASRLNRDGITAGKHTFGDPMYSFEELVAEMGAAFLCAHVGIQSKLQHDSYIASWLKVLQQDKKAIFRASGLARNACEYLLERAQQPLALSA